jgi:hypothetical protein
LCRTRERTPVRCKFRTLTARIPSDMSLSQPCPPHGRGLFPGRLRSNTIPWFELFNRGSQRVCKRTCQVSDF